MAANSSDPTQSSKSACGDAVAEASCSHAAGNPVNCCAPSFNQWRTRNLFGQELLGALFIIATLLLFFYNNHSGVCALRQHYALVNSSHVSFDRTNAPGDSDPGTYPASAARAAVSTTSPFHTSGSGLLSLASVVMCQSKKSGTGHIMLGFSSRYLYKLQTLAQQCKVPEPSWKHGVGKASGMYPSYLVGIRHAAKCLATNAALLVASRGLQALSVVLQVVATICLWGVLAGDPFIFLIVPLRFSLIALLLAPALRRRSPAAAAAAAAAARSGSRRPSSSSSSSSRSADPMHYWHRPRFRYSVIILQRLLPHVIATVYAAATAAAMSGADHNNSSSSSMSAGYLNVSTLKHWLGYSMYLWTGWLACMLQLPLKMHMIVSLLEWLFTFWAGSNVRELYGSSSSSSSSNAAVAQLIVSCVLIWVIPCMVVWMMEKADRERYNVIFRLQGYNACAEPPQHQQQQQREAVGPSALEKPLIVQQQQQASSTAVAAGPCESSSSNGSSSSVSLVRDLDQSLQLAAAALHGSSSSSSSTRARVLDIPIPVQAAAIFDNNTGSNSSNGSSSSMSLVRHLDQSLQLAAAALHGSSSTGARVLDIPIPVQAAAMFSNNTGSNSSNGITSTSVERMRRLVPALRGLLPDDDVVAVFQTAACQASQMPPGVLGVREYQSIAATLPVSVKVHSMPHTSVPVLGPQLESALADHITLHNSSSSSTEQQHWDAALVQMHAVSFPGCVQMLACVFGLRQQLPAAAAPAAAAAGGRDPATAGGNSSSTQELAAGLLSAACKIAEEQHSSSTAAAAAGPSGVDVVVGSTVAAVSGSCCENETAQSSSSSSSVAEVPSQNADHSMSDIQPRYKTLRCEPCCLIAASAAAAAAAPEQHLELHLQSASGSSSRSSEDNAPDHGTNASCRLLVYQFGQIVQDHIIDLIDLDSDHQERRLLARITLPSLPIGVVHIALLPPQQQQQQQDPEQTVPSVDHSTAAAAAATATSESPLLLLQPLLVLPAAAARDLEECRRRLCAAAVSQVDVITSGHADSAVSSGSSSSGGDGGMISCSNAAGGAAAWSVIDQLSTDIGYLMSAAAAVAAAGGPAAAAAGGRGAAAAGAAKPYPPHITACLAHVCKALAQNGMYAALEFLVLYLATAATRNATAAAVAGAGASGLPSSNSSSSSSSESDGPSCSKAARSGKVTRSSTAAAAADNGGGSDNSNSSKQSSTPDSPDNSSSTSVWQLLFGFSSPDLEAKYLARTYASSRAVEIVSYAWTAALMLVLWTVIGKWSADTALKMFVHCVIVFVCNTAMPFGALVLRWRVSRQLRCQQQRQHQQSPLVCTVCSRSNTAKIKEAAGSRVSAAAAADDCDLQQQIYALASKQKAMMMAAWMLLLSLLHCLLASGKITLPPDATEAWGAPDLAHTFAFWVISRAKACMYQLPFAWFIPLFACELATHTAVSLSLGAGWLWALSRVIPGLLVAVAGWQNYRGRKQSMRTGV